MNFLHAFKFKSSFSKHQTNCICKMEVFKLKIPFLLIVMMVLIYCDCVSDYDYELGTTYTTEADIDEYNEISYSKENDKSDEIALNIKSLHNDLKKQRDKQYGIFYYKANLKKKIQLMKLKLSEYNDEVEELENFYRHLGKFTLLELAFCVKSKDFARANEITSDESITLTEWHFIMNEIYDGNSRSLLVLKELNRFMNINNNKLTLYAALMQFNQQKRLGLGSLVQWFATNITAGVEDLFKNALVNDQFFENSVIERIQWNELADIELAAASRLKEKEQHLLLTALNRTINESYNTIKTTDIISDLVEQFAETNTSNKFVRNVYLTGSLLFAIHEHNDFENSELFSLAVNFKKFTNDYMSIDQIIYLRYIPLIYDILKYLPGCVSHIAYASSNIFIIQNEAYKEHLFAYNNTKPSGNYWSWTPAGVSRDHYNPVLTDIKETSVKNAEKWLIEADYDEGKFWIRRWNHHDRYLDLSDETYPHTPITTKKTIKNSIKIVPDAESDICYLKNSETEKYLYAGKNDQIIENKLRMLTMKSLDELAEPSFMWNIKST